MRKSDPHNLTRPVLIPRGSGREGDAWICVNGKSFQIPRGHTWQVPAYVAEVIDRAEKAKERAEAYKKSAGSGAL